MTLPQFGYCFRAAGSGVAKHKTASSVTVTIIAACILLMSLLGALEVNVSHNMDLLQSENVILAFVEEACAENEARSILPDLLSIDGVSEAKFISNQDVYEDYLKNHSEESYGISPSVFRSRYSIVLEYDYKASDVAPILEAFNEIAETRSDDAVIEGFAGIRRVISTVLLFMTALLSVMTVIIITNTIRITVQTRQTEIQIENAMGALASFIRLPFVIEGCILGLLGAVIGFMLFSGMYLFGMNLIMASPASEVISVVPLGDVSLQALVVCLVYGGVVGMIGSSIAVSKTLKGKGSATRG